MPPTSPTSVERGEFAIETDEGERVLGRDAQKDLLSNWHLELSAGQYRARREGRKTARRTKLVHNIVLSMPSPTPPEKVLAAARAFGREKFGHQHRYAMVLHTDQKHPHVHMVVKAESEHGKRLHIDKEMLRRWREDFARMMREQGIAANATPRAIRGNTKRGTKDAIYRAHQRGTSTAVLERAKDVIRQLSETGTVRDQARERLVETRRKLMANWTATADALDVQGETGLAGEVRNFVRALPRVLTDKERMAVQYMERQTKRKSIETKPEEKNRAQENERAR